MHPVAFRPAAITTAAAFVAALILPPFKAGHVFGASGAGAGRRLAARPADALAP